MALRDRLRAIFGRLRSARARRTPGYAAAETSRLTASLASEAQFINNTLRYQLRKLRARSRQACQNNEYGKHWAQMVVDNVGGPQPFRLQAKVKTARGKLDDAANKQIETAWRSWGRKGECEITKRWSWNTVQRLLLRIWATDGEILFRKLRGLEYGRHGYKLQIIDVDRLDESKNERLHDGGAIHMGIEYDPVGAPRAYHILKRKPADWQRGYVREYERILADEIEHIFMPEFAEQGRGVPPMYAALLKLVHIGAFEEAAVIAARVGASQMGFIQSPDGGETLAGDGTDNKGNPQIEADPGQFPFLPPGYQMAAWNPKYPDAAVGPFLKSCLRGVAAGLGVAYHNLANDLEGVNYSSARIGELDERDAWMGLQQFFAEHLHQPLYQDWLRVQVAVAGTVRLDAARFDRYLDVYWQAKRWAWVDPQKEVSANVEAINNKLKSRTRVIAEQGEDIEDVFDELAEEEALAKEKKLSLAPAAKPADNGKPNGDTDGEEKPNENQTAD